MAALSDAQGAQNARDESRGLYITKHMALDFYASFLDSIIKHF